MISIIISEKGGAERRENYDQSEITIGRVKGNDVLLPKGNVSKRHARLIVRDGRYIVTDLKSTNGTYVNHRRITHATLVREGDRIYIGDFVLRIDLPAGAEVAADLDERGPDSMGSQQSVERLAQPAAPGTTSAARLAAGGANGGREEIVSHFPIEHDPDESSPPIDVPAPPRMPSGLQAAQAAGPTPAGETPAVDPPRSDSFGPPTGAHNTAAVVGGTIASSGPSTPVGRSSHPSLDDTRHMRRRDCLEAFVQALEATIGVDRLAGVVVDEALAADVDRAIQAELANLGDPSPLSPGELEQCARLELLEKGPLGALLEDPAISAVHVADRQLVIYRRGQRTEPRSPTLADPRLVDPRLADPSRLGFGSEDGVARAVRRICAEHDLVPGDGPILDLPLPSGHTLFLVRPPASAQGHQLSIERSYREPCSLNTLVRQGAISRSMATLLSCCVAARVNLLLTGEPQSGAEAVVEALCSAFPREHRALWLEERPAEDRLGLRLAGDAAARAATVAAAHRLRPDHLIAPDASAADVAGLLDAVAAGSSGLVVRTSAPTLNQALDRLGATLAASRPGVSVPTAREWLAASFDLGLEVARLRDGRLRVTRLVELRGGQGGTVRDVFSFSSHGTAAGGSVEGAFYASGTVPRIVEDLASRGIALDTTIFRRHPSP